jgi:tetratricopeptide (TPR) repeat protein
VLACLGLGEIALRDSRLQGAESWYTRGLQHVENDPQLTASLWLGLAEVERQRGLLDVAGQRIRDSLALLADFGDDECVVRCLDAWGRLEAQLGHHSQALASHHEALNRLQRAGGELRLEMDIRLNICQLFLDAGRLPDAEDEIRRAEETAIVHNLTRQLARTYVMMGKLRGRQRDETGFVFFEKSAELCRGVEPFPRLEAEVYIEYARFRTELGNADEARALLERAREILESIGSDGTALEHIDREIAELV